MKFWINAFTCLLFLFVSACVVMLNGTEEDNRLWGWDGAWQVVGESGPDGRALGGVAYDPVRDRVVVYGGYSLASNECQYDTWEWDEQGWHQWDVASPEVCSHFTMEYDIVLGKVVLFGGADEQQNPHPGVWTWDGRQSQKGKANNATSDSSIGYLSLFSFSSTKRPCKAT
jgi:hypothetical protein